MEKTSEKDFTSQNPHAIMNIESGGGQVTINSIDSPIEQRHTGKGNPNAILTFDRPLNNRQTSLLGRLPDTDSRAVVRKNAVKMSDLAALTAKTGDEFAMFTRKGERLIIRGSAMNVNVTEDIAVDMLKNGYRWSGHTHPGFDLLCLMPSDGDKLILSCFEQEHSAIYNSKGQMIVFDREGII